jgi:glutathione S-transferase
MRPILYGHPFSSYTQKVTIALRENETDTAFRLLEDAESFAELAALWPQRKFPLLKHGERVVVEASVIIEYAARHFPGPVALLPPDPDAALEVRFLDRFFDLYVMTPMQKIVLDALRPADGRDPLGVAEARAQLRTSYRWLDARMAGRTWATDAGFTLADCAAAPSLFYADWAEPIGADLTALRAYRARLLARPSVARAVDAARPYRGNFPLGAPDRD